MEAIKTKVVHSESKNAWNIIGDILGGKYKIARVPYMLLEGDLHDSIFNTKSKAEALGHALFISNAFNKDWHKRKEIK